MNNNNLQMAGDILFELEEMKKVDVKPETQEPYSITYAFGGVFSIICC